MEMTQIRYVLSAAKHLNFTRAAEEGLVDVGASMHIGVRGPHKGAGVYDQCDALGYPMAHLHNGSRLGGPDRAPPGPAAYPRPPPPPLPPAWEPCPNSAAVP